MENLESPSAPSQFVTSTGVTLEQLASQCAERKELDWDELSPNDKSRWLEAIEALADAVGSQRDTSFSKLTRAFMATYFAADRWDATDRAERLAFEACVRHVVNMITAEDATDVKDAIEYNWAEWVNSKTEK
jgi:hypothetical protein